MINLSKKNGPLQVCIASHKNGFISNYKKFRKNKKYSFQRKVKKQSHYKIFSKPLKEGDVLFMNKNTIHASGKNTSKLIRFSLQVRVHDLMDPDYLSFRYKIIYNQNDINLMIKKGLNVDDLEKVSI